MAKVLRDAGHRSTSGEFSAENPGLHRCKSATFNARHRQLFQPLLPAAHGRGWGDSGKPNAPLTGRRLLWRSPGLDFAITWKQSPRVALRLGSPPLAGLQLEYPAPVFLMPLCGVPCGSQKLRQWRIRALEPEDLQHTGAWAPLP
jgi:hypothetical protein